MAAEGVVAGDQSAHSVLSGLSALERSVRVTWQGPLTPRVSRYAHGLLRSLGLGAQTEVALLNPVRLGGLVVRPAAIAPLDRWVAAGAARGLGPCRAANCPVLAAGGGPLPSRLSAIGVRLRVVGSADLASAVPLGFNPSTGGAQPALVTGDVAGLDALAGLSGVYRTHSWLAALPLTQLHSWQLQSAEGRLAQAQSGLAAADSRFSLSASFSGLDEALAEARAAPQRLLLAAGGAIAALAMFIVLAGGALRADQREELGRLRNAGARTGQCVLFVVAESGWLCAVALGAGALLGAGAGAVLAGAAGEPVGGVLAHSLISPSGAAALAATWVTATAILTIPLMAASARLPDVRRSPPPRRWRLP